MIRWRWAPLKRWMPQGEKSLVVGLNGTLEAIDAIKAGKLLATGDCDRFLAWMSGNDGSGAASAKPSCTKGIYFLGDGD
jgi:hypothetical protein